jgi:hypothetical protein
MSIRYLTLPYDDEIFASWVRRYQRRILLSGITFNKEFFGTNIYRDTLGFPSRISYFVNQIKSVSEIDEDKIIRDLTLWPYYSFFVRKENQARVVEGIRGSGQRVNHIAGISGSGFSINRTPKYCIKCCEEDMNKVGELFWHLSHQIPDVLICSKHNCFLEEALIDQFTGNIVLADENTCQDAVIRPCDNPIVRKVAERMTRLLNTHVTGEEFTIVHYRSLARRIGYFLRAGRNLDFVRLVKDFRCYLGEHTLALYEKSLKRSEAELFPADFFARPRLTLNPVKHLLITGFLESKMSFLNQVERNNLMQTSSANPSSHEQIVEPILAQSIGEKKMTCINTVCNNFEREITTQPVIGFSRVRRIARFDFHCDQCGMVYRIFNDRNENQKPFIVEFGSKWKEKLREGIEQNVQQKLLATQLGVTHQRLSHNAFRYQIINPWRQPKGGSKTSQTKPKKNIYKQKLTVRKRQNLVDNYSGNRKRRPRRDWNMFDQMKSEVIRQKYSEIMSQDPKRRISVALLLRTSGIYATRRFIAEKLPKSHALLEIFTSTLLFAKGEESNSRDKCSG